MRGKVNIKMFDSTPSLPIELGLYSVRQQIIQFHTKLLTTLTGLGLHKTSFDKIILTLDTCFFSYLWVSFGEVTFCHP